MKLIINIYGLKKKGKEKLKLLYNLCKIIIISNVLFITDKVLSIMRKLYLLVLVPKRKLLCI